MDRARVAGGLIWLGILVCTSRGTVADTPLSDGFTEPYRTVEVAASEMGIISEMHAQEGQTVRRGQLLAILDPEPLKAQLAVAEQSANAQGALLSARTELHHRRDRLTKLEEVLAKGYARPEEITRARADVAIAEANLLSVEEDLQVKRLEIERLRIQLERRNVRAPIDGVINQRHKEAGEFVAPNDYKIFSLVQLNPLAANFSVGSSNLSLLRLGLPVQLVFDGVPTPAAGVIDFIAPVTDAESGTVRVRVRLDNPENRYRSGERCTLQVAEPSRSATPELKPARFGGEPRRAKGTAP